jgi:signal peptidase I
VKRLWWEIVLALGVALGFYLVLSFAIQNSIVEGNSMQPGLLNGQRLIVNKAAFLFQSPQRGQIVVIYPPVATSRQWVKRIIGLPGDTVRITQGRVYVNGVALSEPYIRETPQYSLAEITIPPDNYFVLGDNRNNSTDSHYGWTVPRHNIVGSVWLRFWPLNNWGLIHIYPLAAELNSAAE